ncbi:MAG: head-tail connector protein [Hyphomicrobiales bacterium]|nr:head-tail connector protein [Hyphomicrobiales bacterium]
MTLFRTTAPAVEPVTVAEAKAQLRIGHDGEDDFINGLIRAAREEVEARAGVAMIAQDWRLALDRWPRFGRVALLRHPVVEILSVTVYGAEGEASLVDPSTYEADLVSRPARLYFTTRPEPACIMNGIEIDFAAGFGADAKSVPERLKRAILVLVAHWYEFRAGFSAGDQPVSIPPEFERLISSFRRGRL